MPLYALNACDELVAAREALRQRDYRCRDCGGTVRVRGSSRRKWHFYHLHAERRCELGGKSLVHLQIQERICGELPDGQARMEVPFPSVGRIADVFWEEQALVFEVQCSAISAEEVLARNRDYESCGCRVIWVLHDRRYNKPWAADAESVLAQKDCYYCDIDQDGQGEIYDHPRLVIDARQHALSGPFRIDCAKVSRLRDEDFLGKRPQFAADRAIYCEGDATSRCLADPLFCREVIRREARLCRWQEGTLLAGVKRFVNFCSKPYRSVFQVLLERACR